MSADRMFLVVSLSLSFAAWHGQNVWAEDGPSTSGEREAGGSPKQEEGRKQAIPLPPKRKQPEPGPEAFILSSDVVKGQIPVKSWKTLRDRQIVKQDQDYSCGAASLATLLKGFYGQKLTEEQLLNGPRSAKVWLSGTGICCQLGTAG